MRTASIRVSAALVLLPLLASAQATDQSPPAAFQTPSGNVHCLLRDAALHCQVVERAWEPPAACAGGWGGLLRLRPGQAPQVECAGRPVRDDEAFVLGYGAKWLGPGIACESEEAGLRCESGTGHGFQVSRTRLTMF